jgi:hypothetical protein
MQAGLSRHRPLLIDAPTPHNPSRNHAQDPWRPAVANSAHSVDDLLAYKGTVLPVRRSAASTVRLPASLATSARQPVECSRVRIHRCFGLLAACRLPLARLRRGS